MTNNLKKNIQSGKIVTIGAYLLGAVAFLIAWYFSGIFWYLLAGIILFTSSILFLFLFKWVEKRLTKDSKK